MFLVISNITRCLEYYIKLAVSVIFFKKLLTSDLEKSKPGTSVSSEYKYLCYLILWTGLYFSVSSLLLVEPLVYCPNSTINYLVPFSEGLCILYRPADPRSFAGWKFI